MKGVIELHIMQMSYSHRRFTINFHLDASGQIKNAVESISRVMRAERGAIGCCYDGTGNAEGLDDLRACCICRELLRSTKLLLFDGESESSSGIKSNCLEKELDTTPFGT